MNRQPIPSPAAPISRREMLLSVLGALAGLFVTIVIARQLLAPSAQPFLVASMGATAVLLYAASASPMAQPWAVFGGHLASALIGATCARYIPDTAWAAAIAGSGAIAVMYVLRCMHPPGGATALMPVASAPVGELGYSYVLAPVGIDVVLMLTLALLINHYLLKRPYPARRTNELRQLAEQGLRHAPQRIRPPFREQDLQLALQQMNTYIDVTHEDLLRIYGLSRMNAYARKAGDRPARDFIVTAPATLGYEQALSDALRTLNDSDESALPVLDKSGRVCGVMGIVDLTTHAGIQAGSDTITRLAALLTPSETVHSDKPEAVGQVMQPKPLLATADQPVAALLSQMVDHTPEIVPVLDAEQRLVGIIRPEELMASLHRL